MSNILIKLSIIFVAFIITGCNNSTVNMMEKKGIEVDLLRLQYEASPGMAQQVASTVSMDGKEVAFVYDDGTIKTMDLEKSVVLKRFKVPINKISHLKYNFDKTKLAAVSLENELYIIDLESEGIHQKKNLPHGVSKLDTSPVRDQFAVGSESGTVTVFDFMNLQIEESFDIGKKSIGILEYHPMGDEIALGMIEVKKDGAVEFPIYFYDVNNGTINKKLKANEYTSGSYSPDGESFYFTTLRISDIPQESSFMVNRLTELSAEVMAKRSLVKYSFENGQSVNLINEEYGHGIGVVWTSINVFDNHLLLVDSEENFFVYDLSLSGENMMSKLVYTTQTEAQSSRFKNRKQAETGIDRIFPLFDGDNFYISYSDDNVNEIFSISKRKIYTYLYSDADENWAAVTRDGRMDGTEQAISNVYWERVSTGKKVPLEATFDQFYTPALLSSILTGKRSFERDDQALAKAVDLAPVVEIVNPVDNVKTSKSNISITVNATPKGDPIKEIKVFVNDKPLGGEQRGFKLSEDSNSQTFEVTLLPGLSTIRAVAVSQSGYESAPAQINATYEGATDQARLYILAVGIDQYKNPSYNLNYATADASAFTKEVQQVAGGIFEDIEVTYIKNDQATKQNISQAIQSIKEHARLQDAFIFYYAGHGVMSEGSQQTMGDFYLALHDVTQLYGQDQILAEKGISAAEMRDIFASIEAQKQLILLDACQSGGAVETFAMRGAAEEKAMIQLARSSGVVLLASTGSEQFATEFEQLGHGVFTYAILQGLDGKADSGDGKVTVKELEAYLNDAVPDLNQRYKGAVQYPRSWSQGMDFPIGIIGN